MKKALVIVAVVLVSLAIAVGFVYAFGKPVAPEQPAAVTGAAGGAPGATTATAVPAPDPASPLAIEIPGCVCHSDDPKQVAAHAEYRMNQCAGCHMGGVPTGAK